MSGKYKSKTRKVVETSLGKAPKAPETVPDESHLRKPITTSVHGLKEVIALFQTATTEIQDYITYECDILYECRSCRTIFRSLANFILHKRRYCKEKLQFGDGRHPQGGFVITDELKTSDEDSRCATPVDKGENDLEGGRTGSKKGILPIIDQLIKKQKVQILAKKTLNEDLSQKTENSDDDVIFISEDNSVALQKIEGSEAAVFQTAIKNDGKFQKDPEGLMKAEILEIHGILDRQAVLGSNGKICTFSTNKLTDPDIPKQDLTCSECNFTFSTEKTLTHHIRYKHNKTCIVFPCPDCKESFSNAWSVYRHLYKVHRRTIPQVRRMRHLVHSSRIRKDQEPEKKKRKLDVIDENEENQWMNNFEGDKDLQMCGGCGKRFERKAALHSHSQMCTKRIAVCNSIKNVKASKNEKKEKVGENTEVKVKGAAKRKQHIPTVIHTEKTIEEDGKLPLPESLDPDVTITKHYEPVSEADPLAIVPAVEVFTISDDSNDNEPSREEPIDDEKEPICEPEIPDPYKAYINDEEDNCFMMRMRSYVDKDDLKCIPCETTFMSSYTLLRHMSLHFSWFRFQCSKCNFMSFHKYDCTTHAVGRHYTSDNLIESTVLPIPKWKVLCTSHEFKTFDEEDDTQMDETEMMPRLEAVDVTEVKIQENGVEPPETIILEDDEMPDICTENGSFSDTMVLSDDDRKEKKKIQAGPSVINSRPIRNRIKSVKTVQNDFIYDLGKAVKINDNSSKNKKLKKMNKS